MGDFETGGIMKTLTEREIIKYFGKFDYKEGKSGRIVILWHPLACCSPELYVEGIRGPENPVFSPNTPTVIE